MIRLLIKTKENKVSSVKYLAITSLYNICIKTNNHCQ